MILRKIGKIIIGLVFILAVLAVSFFYFLNRVSYSHGIARESREFIIEKGESNRVIGERLAENSLIAGKYYFYYYMWSRGLAAKILPGEYAISGNLTVPEIAAIITNEKSRFVKITFPEGWTNKKIKNQISKIKINVDDFDYLAGNADYFKEKYAYNFLNSLPEKATLEGFLFPDTYYFYQDASSEDIIKKMLDNFDRKLSSDLKDEIKRQGKNVYEIITMASIIEGEVRTDEDRKIVSGIFWDRVNNNQALESCATLAYVTGENKKQYSEADTKINSPYNTYLHKGLPPAPISNPGLSAIQAAIYPVETSYNYFLSDPETGETIFSKTYEEHIANKARYGL